MYIQLTISKPIFHPHKQKFAGQVLLRLAFRSFDQPNQSAPDEVAKYEYEYAAYDAATGRAENLEAHAPDQYLPGHVPPNTTIPPAIYPDGYQAAREPKHMENPHKAAKNKSPINPPPDSHYIEARSASSMDIPPFAPSSQRRFTSSEIPVRNPGAQMYPDEAMYAHGRHPMAAAGSAPISAPNRQMPWDNPGENIASYHPSPNRRALPLHPSAPDQHLYDVPPQGHGRPNHIYPPVAAGVPDNVQRREIDPGRATKMDLSRSKSQRARQAAFEMARARPAGAAPSAEEIRIAELLAELEEARAAEQLESQQNEEETKAKHEQAARRAAQPYASIALNKDKEVSASQPAAPVKLKTASISSNSSEQFEILQVEKRETPEATKPKRSAQRDNTVNDINTNKRSSAEIPRSPKRLKSPQHPTKSATNASEVSQQHLNIAASAKSPHSPNPPPRSSTIGVAPSLLSRSPAHLLTADNTRGTALSTAEVTPMSILSEAHMQTSPVPPARRSIANSDNNRSRNQSLTHVDGKAVIDTLLTEDGHLGHNIHHSMETLVLSEHPSDDEDNEPLHQMPTSATPSAHPRRRHLPVIPSQ